MATIKDVAHAAGVSFATVSRTLNNPQMVNVEVQKKVLKAIKELGYSPNYAARALATKKTEAIGIVLNKMYDPFFYDLMRGFEEGTKGTRNKIVYTSAPSGDYKSKEKNVRYLSNGVVDGIILYGSYQSDEAVIDYLEATDFPFIVIENELPQHSTNNLLIDNRGGESDAVEFLIKQGHRRIAYICGDPNRRVMTDRLSGYIDAVQRSRLIINEGYIQYANNYIGGYEKMKTFAEMGENRPTAVICSDDSIASYAIRCAIDLGLRVPEDISVMGFNNQSVLPIGYRGPDITSVEQPLFQIGVDSVQLLSGMLEKEETEKIHKVYPVKLVEKGSTAAPSGADKGGYKQFTTNEKTGGDNSCKNYVTVALEPEKFPILNI